jgi:hypothetical protein
LCDLGCPGDADATLPWAVVAFGPGYRSHPQRVFLILCVGFCDPIRTDTDCHSSHRGIG